MSKNKDITDQNMDDKIQVKLKRSINPETDINLY